MPHKTGALATHDLERVVVVDTTVQPKAIAHPTDARLCPLGEGFAELLALAVRVRREPMGYWASAAASRGVLGVANHLSDL